MSPNPVASPASSSKAFAVCVVVLALAAATLNGAVQFLNLHFKKEPVALAKPLEQIPAQLGPWVQVSLNEPMNAEFLDILGTREYIFRQYVDSRIVGAVKIDAFHDKDVQERAQMLSEIQRDHPEAVIKLAVTYYTGMVDTVAHIPDRCYVADGYEPTEYAKPKWKLFNKDGKPQDVEVRYINFEDQTPGRGSIPKNVGYVFHCNGEYESDPIEGVRMRLQNLFERKGYYAKIELMNVMGEKRNAERVMEQFLATALPEIEKCFPDWKKVNTTEQAEPATKDAKIGG